MGYVVGRNSAPLVTSRNDRRVRSEAKPLVVDSPAPAPKQSGGTGNNADSGLLGAQDHRLACARRNAGCETAETQAAAETESAPKRPKRLPKQNRRRRKPWKSPNQPRQRLALRLRPHRRMSNSRVLSICSFPPLAKHDADAMVHRVAAQKNGFPATDVEVPEKLGHVPRGEWVQLRATINKTKAPSSRSKGFAGTRAIKRQSIRRNMDAADFSDGSGLIQLPPPPRLPGLA